jgi:HtrA serine peptidase 1
MINHDVIISINGQPIQTTDEVSDAVQSGSPLSVVVRRANEDVMINVVPEEID